jgi:hypothetical protein
VCGQHTRSPPWFFSRSVAGRLHKSANLPALMESRMHIHICVAAGENAQCSGKVAGGQATRLALRMGPRRLAEPKFHVDS